LGHFLDHEEKQLAIPRFHAAETAKLTQETSILPRTTPSGAVI